MHSVQSDNSEKTDCSFVVSHKSEHSVSSIIRHATFSECSTQCFVTMLRPGLTASRPQQGLLHECICHRYRTVGVAPGPLQHINTVRPSDAQLHHIIALPRAASPPPSLRHLETSLQPCHHRRLAASPPQRYVAFCYATSPPHCLVTSRPPNLARSSPHCICGASCRHCGLAASPSSRCFARLLCQLTTSLPCHLAASSPHCLVTSLPPSLTTSRPRCIRAAAAALPPHHLSAASLHRHLAASQPRHLITLWQPCPAVATASPPHHLRDTLPCPQATSPPHCLVTSLTHHLTTLSPLCLTTLLPQQLAAS